MAEKSAEFGKSGNSKYLNKINADIKSQILFEDNHIIAINKLPRQLVQGDDSGDECLLDIVKAYIKKKYDKPGDVFLGTVHRLDRPVSGVVVFARTSKALERMNKAFANREIQKTYLAIVEGTPKKHDDTLIDFIAKDAKRKRSHVFNKAKLGAKQAELSYSVKKHIAGKSLLEVKPITGRPHQIRVQLAKIGHSIVGDLKYGAKDRNIDRSISLHAHKLTFTHPTKKEPVTITAKTPRTSIWITFM